MKSSRDTGRTKARTGKPGMRREGELSASRRRWVVLAGLCVIAAAVILFAFKPRKEVPASWPTALKSSASNVVFEAPIPLKQQPQTLNDLLQVPPDQLEGVDLGVMNLLCAEGLSGSEGLDVQQCLDRLGAWSLRVEQETKRNLHHFLERPKEFKDSLPYYRLGMLGTVLAEDLQIQYSPEHEQQLLAKPVNQQSVEDENRFFSSSADVFIHGLLGGKHRGTCASMPFLYAAIGRRLGYPVTIAARKYHLYIRYEGVNGEHLNTEATENRGFATPTDEEYRNGQYPMTQEEIDGAGWLRPLSNKEILGICLLNRANCLRSMKQYDQEIKTLAHAARYVPDSVLMTRVIEKNQELARNLHAADRWDELWAELEALLPPTAGPRFEHFQNRKLQVQFFVNQSTNLVEIEKAVSEFREDFRRFRNQASDDLPRLAASFVPPAAPLNQQLFAALLADAPQGRRVVLRQEQVPHEYWNGVPPALQERLRKLTKEEEILEEMHAFAAEEAGLRNQEAMLAMGRPPVLAAPQPFGQKPQVNLRPSDLPLPWRGRAISPELLERLESLNTISEPSVRQMRTREEIDRFFMDQDQRRFALDQEPVTRPPLQIVIVPAPAANSGSPALPNSILPRQPEKSIQPSTPTIQTP